MENPEAYRGALGAAQRRIESLERDLETARYAWPTVITGTPYWVMGLASIGGLTVFFVGFVFLAVSCSGNGTFGVQ